MHAMTQAGGPRLREAAAASQLLETRKRHVRIHEQSETRQRGRPRLDLDVDVITSFLNKRYKLKEIASHLGVSFSINTHLPSCLLNSGFFLVKQLSRLLCLGDGRLLSDCQQVVPAPCSALWTQSAQDLPRTGIPTVIIFLN